MEAPVETPEELSRSMKVRQKTGNLKEQLVKDSTTLLAKEAPWGEAPLPARILEAVCLLLQNS